MTRRQILQWLTVAGAAGVSGAALLLPKRANAYYAGPPSDHFDGELFFSPSAQPPRGLWNVGKLYALESWSTWPAAFPSPFRDRPPPAVGMGQVRVGFVGHASWLVQADGLNVLIDPHWSEKASPNRFVGPRRAQAPGIAFDDLPTIHVVLVTHNHYDHMDTPTLKRLMDRDRPRVITPLGNDTIMRDEIPGFVAEAVDWGAVTALSPSVALHTVPAEHWSARGIRDRRHALWSGFVLETSAGKVYAAGDSGLGDGRVFRDIGRAHPGVKLALMPIGAYEPRWFMASQHMNPMDSVTAFKLVGAERALGCHWGTFQLTTEPYDDPPKALAAALAAERIEPERFPAVRPGESVAL